MHELSLVENLFAQCRQHAQGRHLERVCLQVGALTCVDPDALMFCFDACKEAAELPAAELVITVESALAVCAACERHFVADSLPIICQCGSSQCEVSGGQDVMLQALEFRSVESE